MKWIIIGMKPKIWKNSSFNRNIIRLVAYPLVTFVLLLVLIFDIQAQSPATAAGHFEFPDRPNKTYFKSYLKVAQSVYTAPFHWNKKQWITAAGVTAVGVMLYVFDGEIRTVFRNNQSDGVDIASKYVFEPWGSGLYPAITMGSFYVVGLAFNEPRARQIALGGTQAWVLSAVTVQAIKHLTHRHRPDQDVPANPRLWEGPFSGFSYTSFPSGHTITAFSLASFMSSVYHEKVWVSVLAYGLATGVGLSRIYDDAHWSSDVFIGAVLGFAIGKTVYRLMQPGGNLCIAPGSRGGIALVYRL